jgi:SAM-dependent methyltransferase
MKVLNLGCGARTSPLCTNVDWSPYLRLKQSRVGERLAKIVLRGERLERFQSLSSDVVVANLRHGIPAANGTADVVYHSHLLEHLDRSVVPSFLSEVLRVLKPGGRQRIAVPDFEQLCRVYLADLEKCDRQGTARAAHDRAVEYVIEQMVRQEAVGSRHQPPFRRFVENVLVGDAHRRGETHRWMYDRVNLSHVLEEAGFCDVEVVGYDRSTIPGWDAIALDKLADGSEYIPHSLYVEAVKP